MPNQVRNILSGRMINEENALFSSVMGGYIHRNSATTICTAISIDRTAWSTFRFDSAYVSTDWFFANKVMVHYLTTSTNGELVYDSRFCVPSIDLSAFRSFEMNGKTIYTDKTDISTDNFPEWFTIEVVEVESNATGQSGILSFKDWMALEPHLRPTSQNGVDYSLRKVGSKRIPRIVVTDDNRILSSYRGERCQIDGVDGRYFFERNSASHNAFSQWENQRWGGHRSGIFGYHSSGGHRSQYDAQRTEGNWYFGIEAEKQDSDAKRYADYLGGKCGQWGAERDGSLGSGGVEFISPILPLHNGSFVRKNFQQHRWMLDAKLDDNNSTNRANCGGHMTISKVGMSGTELANHLHHFAPLFYSLYIGRLNTNYGGATTKSRFGNRQAFNIKSFGVEIRIFSGVPSMEGAWWRVQLLQVITKMIDNGEVQSYKDVANAMVTEKHPLRKVMRKMYDSKRIRDKFALTLTFGHLYENNGDANINLEGTSDDVKHKAERITTAFNQFREVRLCTSRLWNVDSVSAN